MNRKRSSLFAIDELLVWRRIDLNGKITLQLVAYVTSRINEHILREPLTPISDFLYMQLAIFYKPLILLPNILR